MCLLVQSCLTLCDPMDCSPPGFSVPGDSPGKNTGAGCHAFLQGIFQPRDQTKVSCIATDSLPAEPPGKPKNTRVISLSLLQWSCPGSPSLQVDSLPAELTAKSKSCLTVILWTLAYQTLLSMEFSRQEYWSGLPCPPPGDLPHLGIKLRSPALQVNSLLSEPPGRPIHLKYSVFSLIPSCCL